MLMLHRLTGGLRSLKLRITLGAVAAQVLGLGLITAVLVQRAEHDTLRDQTEREQAEAVRSAALLSRDVVDLQRSMGMVAAQLSPALLRDRAALLRFIEAQPVWRGQFSHVFLSSPEGQLLLLADEQGPRSIDYSIADRAYFRRTLAEGRALVSEAVPGRLSGAALIVLTQPLIKDGQVYAVLGGSLRLSDHSLLAHLVDAQESDRQVLTVVSDAQGTVLAHPDARRLMQPLQQEPRIAGAYAAWQAAGSPVEPSGLQLRQAGQVVSAAGVAGPDWMVWRARPEQELLAPLHAARAEAMTWAGGLILLLSGLTLLLLSRLLRPLEQLEERAQTLFDGAQPADQGWPTVGGEIGALSQVLQRVGSERLRLEAANDELLQRLRSVLAASPIGIAFTRQQCFELVSAEFCRLFGREEAEFLGTDVALMYAQAEDSNCASMQILEAFRLGLPYVGEWEMLRADGSRFWGQLRGRPLASGQAEPGTIWTLSDISEARRARQELEWKADHDPLTGLANRRQLELRASALLNGRPETLPAALVFIDLDHFKPINDRGGHAAGDAMLVAVAAAIKSAVRSTDLVARPGGDEFALLLEHCKPATALRIAEAVRGALAAVELSWDGQTYSIGSSLGVAHLGPDTPHLEAWFAQADAACYAAKSAGRNQVRSAA